jgi:cytochrome c peroxidase
MEKKDRLRLVLHVFLTLLAAVFVLALVFPRNETVPSSPNTLNIPSTLSNMRSPGNAILPIPGLSPEELKSGKVLLGEKLFHDARLSGDGTISCATCHDLSRSGADGRKVSAGAGGALGDLNSPTVFNSVFNFRQFWDGRADTLSDQVSGPLTDIAEMASSWTIAVQRVSEDKEYRKAFDREYGGEISEKTISDAIARFEATLLTPNAPFDRYLNGDTAAISKEAREGYRRFIDFGCVSCHQGVNLGGNFFQRFGVMGNYLVERGIPSKADQGRYNVTGQKEDLYVFKVPGLRNVAATAPYFHDGSIDTLDEAIEIMVRYQLGRELPEEDRRYLAAFLESLTGEYRGEPVKP